LSQKSPFLLRERNPDVLTSIANLSNDEVFTPPTFANQMLDTVAKAWAESNDGAVIWEDKSVKFLDPFTKSGVFLREIIRRLSEGLEKEIPNLQDRINHIVSKQVFGIAITQLTALTTRRSVYCSKRANGKHSIATIFNDEEGSIWFKRTEHTWAGGVQKVITVDEAGNEIEKKLGGKCKFCGASQSEYERDKALESHAYALIHTEDPKKLIKEVFGEEMQFDVIIGNPPYQLSDGGGSGTSAAPIYQHFVNQAIALEPRFVSMVIPARWFAGGKGLDDFRQKMLTDDQVREIHDYPDSSQVFPGVQIKGGVCFYVWEKGSSGNTQVTTHMASSHESTMSRPLLEPGADVFVRFNEAIPILRKILKAASGGKDSGLGLPEGSRFSQLVSTRQPFGLSSTYSFSDSEKPELPIVLYKVGGETVIPRSEVTKGTELIDRWKVMIPFLASGSDSFPHPILGKPFVAHPGSVCTETYLVIGPFDSKAEAARAISYISTRIFRFLVLLRKPSQNATKKVYEFVPLVDFGAEWSDSALMKLWGISTDELLYISSLVRPFEESDE
jgi:hypothetical protein